MLGLDEVSDERGDEAEGDRGLEVGMQAIGGGEDLGDDEAVLPVEVTPREAEAVDVIGGGGDAGGLLEAELATTRLRGEILAASSGGRGSFSNAARLGCCGKGLGAVAFSGLRCRFKCESSLSRSVKPYEVFSQ